MTQYVLKRLLSMVPVLFGLTLALFFLLRVIPGDAAAVMLEDSPTARDKEQLRESLGLNEPLYRQYGIWVGQVLRGDLGKSFWTNGSVAESMRRAAPVTIELTLSAASLAFLIGVPLGVLSAANQNKWWDQVIRAVSILGLAVPSFWLGTLALVLPAIWFGWVPPAQYRPIWESPLQNLQQIWLPALVIGVSASASLMRMTRSAMLEVLRNDYVRTARAKGLSERKVIVGHAVKNAMLPVVTLFGTLIAGLLTGSIVVETIFNLRGFGNLVVEAISNRDYPMIQGCVLVFGLVYSFVNLAIDISYTFLNPRVRYG